jgi:hypothetical protein
MIGEVGGQLLEIAVEGETVSIELSEMRSAHAGGLKEHFT